jgi:hypothetical protein
VHTSRPRLRPVAGAAAGGIAMPGVVTPGLRGIAVL